MYSEFIEFLIQAVDEVARLFVTGNSDRAIPLSAVKSLLTKKCSYVVISDRWTKVSSAQVEELVQVRFLF